MREIKFRGKRIDNGEWVYGYYFQGFTGISYILVMHDHILGMTEFYEVDPSTVGQYTGLKNKHGKEIYEGDIIVGTYKEDIGTDTGLVVFKCYGFKVEIPNVGDDELVDWERYSDSIEVISNIHDNNVWQNPELLEGAN